MGFSAVADDEGGRDDGCDDDYDYEFDGKRGLLACVRGGAG